MNSLEAFADRDAVAAAAASALAGALGVAGARSFVATGGTTPGPAYDRLALAEIDWAAITVTPSDERFVDPDSDQSNERLIRQRLLVGRAAAARLLPLKCSGRTPADDAATAEPKLEALLPFAAVLLGMGEDGHIGSLFPDAPDLASLLDPDGERLCIGVAASGEKPFVPRISLTLRAYLESALVLILITGAPKRSIVGRVASDPDFAPPVAAALRQSRTPVRVLWAP